MVITQIVYSRSIPISVTKKIHFSYSRTINQINKLPLHNKWLLVPVKIKSRKNYLSIHQSINQSITEVTLTLHLNHKSFRFFFYKRLPHS